MPPTATPKGPRRIPKSPHSSNTSIHSPWTHDSLCSSRLSLLPLSCASRSVRDRCSLHGAHRARGQARPFGAVLGRRNATAATPGGERSYSRRRDGSAAPGADIAEFDRAANLAHLLRYSFGHRMGRYIEVDHSTPFISQHQKRTTPRTRIVWSVWHSPQTDLLHGV